LGKPRNLVIPAVNLSDKLRMNCTDRNGMLKDVVHDLDSALSGWH
jgi:hypothetical protein